MYEQPDSDDDESPQWDIRANAFRWYTEGAAKRRAGQFLEQGIPAIVEPGSVKR